MRALGGLLFKMARRASTGLCRARNLDRAVMRWSAVELVRRRPSAHAAREIPAELVVMTVGTEPVAFFPGCHGVREDWKDVGA